MPRLTWSPSARGDLKGIDAFLAERDAAAAVRILRAIRITAERLRDYPQIGRALDEPFRVLMPANTACRVNSRDRRLRATERIRRAS